MSQFGDEDLNTVLLGSIPKHEDLCCLKGKINLAEKNTTNLSNKAYQCQIFKCRCLIFTVPEVIASPVLGAVQYIHIIISQDYYHSDKLKPHLDKMNILVEEPIPLTNAVYEACLRYTILARLAPSWNQVERYLVHGRDFLLSSAPLDAVKLDIVINETDMHIALWPLRLRLPQVCAQDIQVSSFNSPFSCDPVHVLPSLNCANVLMVSGHIPQNSLFKSYKDLKRHWKNSYGYRLPENEEGMIYLTVKFGRWFSESLTYPILCVRARRPVFLRQHEPQKVLLELLADLHHKIPFVCGFPFGIETTFRYALPKLNVLTQAVFPSNLSETMPKAKRWEEEDKVENSNCSQPVSQYTQTQTCKLKLHPEPSTVPSRSISPPPFLPHMSQMLSATSSKPVYVPVFTAKSKPKYSCSTSTPQWQPYPLSPSPPKEDPLIPILRGTPTKPMFGLAQPTPPWNTFHSSKLAPKERNIQHCPVFNSSSTSSRPFDFKKGEKTLLHLQESGGKKVRNKPQVQQGIDVKALAHMKDGLAKVNTTTLIAYLRSEGVPCKVKDKKGELVAKVLTHLKLPVSSTTLQIPEKD